MRSPLTGKMAIYYESYSVHTTTPAATAPDLNTLETRITNDLYTQQVDGFCDGILAIQGVTQDIYKPRLWIASEQPTLEARFGERLIAPAIVIALIYAITIIAAAIIAVVVVYMLSQSFMTLSEYVLQPPSYTGGTTADPTTFDNWSEYYTYQSTLYWYVCPKCGAGFGLKSEYATPEDVPQSIIDAYNEHVEICLGVPKGARTRDFLLWVAIVAVAGLGGLYIVGKVIEARPWR
ncbi:hypothetical protein CH330_01425 [candidate division WOR-3 bacterium JGI_Cruoil_03_51_56]|uniref:Uncharacterized protein n=1 Tax=candidate division WOR-3 bacterium JGI_Cruoil_03_51_56 TaxID=1973747 RepID=A0A235BYU6_UNCW3|nr:MAG: hypothetical protein CH330_01425 [candidate division WOR-3 bacterium JGI_Cruoil_03_51_56]